MEAHEDEFSPFVTNPRTRRCRCKPGSRETEWSGEEEVDATEAWEAEPQAIAEDEEAGWAELEDESAGPQQFESPYVSTEEEDEAGATQGLRTRIAEVARKEWETWGKGTKTETDPAMHPTLRTYWETVVKRGAVDEAIQKRRAWSAAFVSYVMRQAGAGAAFPGGAAHYLYVSAAKRARANRDASKFQAYEITAVKPEVGDVVCRDRPPGKGSCGGTTFGNVDDGQYHATHCDVVTEVRAGSITVIGGNVGGPKCPKSGCTVNARPVRLDARGFVVPRPGGCAYFAILKAPGRAAVGAPAAARAPAAAAGAVSASFALPSPRGWNTRGRPRKQVKIGAIVVHTTGSGLAAKAEKNRKGAGRGCTTALDCGLEYYGPNGSGGFPHYLIGYDGAIYATCSEDRIAYHAGWVKEIGGRGAWKPGRWSPPPWWAKVWGADKTPLDLLPPGAAGPNIRSIGVELLGAAGDGEYTEAQYRSLARLVVDVDRRHGIGIDRAPSPKLLGHEDLNPLTGQYGRANADGGWDPGAHRRAGVTPRFSWARLWGLIEQGRMGREFEEFEGEDEDESGPGDAESEFVGEAWEAAPGEEPEQFEQMEELEGSYE